MALIRGVLISQNIDHEILPAKYHRLSAIKNQRPSAIRKGYDFIK